MIQPVTMDQEHFRVPTLRTDSRGLVIGDRGLLRFSILPQVVSFFQALTKDQSLDGLASSLRLLKVRSRVHGLELVVDFPAQGSYLVDRAAQTARLLKGNAYTGSWPHFVPYRDRRAPFGYDATELVVWQNGPVFYGRHGAQKFEVEGELSFEQLILGLNLQRVDPVPSAHCVLRVSQGLRGAVQSFLTRRRIPASVARVVREPRSEFDREETLYLFKIAEMPPRLYALFGGLPGVEVYHARGHQVFVERGWSHPFAIESCRRFFDEAHLYFFSGSRDEVDRLDGDALTYVDLHDIHVASFRVGEGGGPQPVHDLTTAPIAKLRGLDVDEALTYQVDLVRVPGDGGSITGVWLREPRELAWLKRVVYAMPRAALESYRAAYTDHGVCLICADGIEWVPFGMPLKEHFPRVYLPAGMRLAPPVSYEHLAASLGLERGHVYVLPETLRNPLAIPESMFRPLVNYLLADVDVTAALDRAPPMPPEPDGVELRSGGASVFSLWRHNIFKPGLTTDQEKAPMLPGDDHGSD